MPPKKSSDRIRNEDKVLDAQHHDFMSVVHIFENNPRFSERTLPCLYKNHTIFSFFTPVAHHGTQPEKLSHIVTQNIQQQKELGVLINYAWHDIQCRAIKWGRKAHFLAQYCGFNGNEEITAYADTIGKCLSIFTPIRCHAESFSTVSEIVHEAALLASNLGNHTFDDDLPHSMV